MARLNKGVRVQENTDVARREADAKGLKTYKKKGRCIHGHNSERYTASGQCIKCSKIIGKVHSQLAKKKTTPIRDAAQKFCKVPNGEETVSQADYRKNKKKIRAYQKKYYKKYFQDNREKHKAYMAKYRARRKAIASAIEDGDRVTICKLVNVTNSNKSFHSSHLKKS